MHPIASSSMLVFGAFLWATLTTTSAFVSTTPLAASILSSRGQRLPSGSGNMARSSPPPSAGAEGAAVARGATGHERLAPAMVLGAGMGGQGLVEIGSVFSGVVGQAHASAVGSGLGTLFLLAEDPAAPPNIFGEVALGGFFIVFSGVFSSYIVATMIRNMPVDQLQKLTAELGGGREMEDLEAQRIETVRRFKELTKDMEQAADPTMGVKPDEKLADRLSKQTAKALSTDIASIEDEYAD